jgi:hypothetical protein
MRQSGHGTMALLGQKRLTCVHSFAANLVRTYIYEVIKEAEPASEPESMRFRREHSSEPKVSFHMLRAY